jgi:hypothetical protein
MAKLVPTFAGREFRVFSVTVPYGRESHFSTAQPRFFIECPLSFLHEAEWTQFQIRYSVAFSTRANYTD